MSLYGIQSYTQPREGMLVTTTRKAVLRSRLVAKPLQEWGEAEEGIAGGLPSSGNFPLDTECGVYGLRYSWEPAGVSCPGSLRAAVGLQTMAGPVVLSQQKQDSGP